MMDGADVFAPVNCGRLPALTVFLIAASAGAASSWAQTFDIHAPEAKRGEVEIETLNAANLGPARGPGEFVRDAHELKLTYGVSDFWKVEFGGLLEYPSAHDPRFSRVAFENVFVLRAADKVGLGLGWFTSVEAATNSETTNAVIFGPIVSWKADKFSALANPFFEKTFGQNHEEGIAFTYTWQAKLEIEKGFGIGVEGLGRIENISASPPISQQDHRIGPSLYFTKPLGQGQELEIGLGTFIGMTRGSPDATLKLNLAISFAGK
jgi:hypothetical protein